jgi:hypothetical protein
VTGVHEGASVWPIGAHVCTLWDEQVHVCTPVGLNNRTLEAKMTGAKLIFFGDVNVFIFEMVDRELDYVVAGDHLDDVGSLERERLVTAQGGCDQ